MMQPPVPVLSRTVTTPPAKHSLSPVASSVTEKTPAPVTPPSKPVVQPSQISPPAAAQSKPAQSVKEQQEPKKSPSPPRAQTVAASKPTTPPAAKTPAPVVISPVASVAPAIATITPSAGTQSSISAAAATKVSTATTASAQAKPTVAAPSTPTASAAHSATSTVTTSTTTAATPPTLSRSPTPSPVQAASTQSPLQSFQKPWPDHWVDSDNQFVQQARRLNALIGPVQPLSAKTVSTSTVKLLQTWVAGATEALLFMVPVSAVQTLVAAAIETQAVYSEDAMLPLLGMLRAYARTQRIARACASQSWLNALQSVGGLATLVNAEHDLVQQLVALYPQIPITVVASAGDDVLSIYLDTLMAENADARREAKLVNAWVGSLLSRSLPSSGVWDDDGALARNAHKVEWTHSKTLLRILTQPHKYQHDVSALQALVNRSGFVAGLVELCLVHRNIREGIDACNLTGNDEALERLLRYCLSQSDWQYALSATLKAPFVALDVNQLTTLMLDALGVQAIDVLLAEPQVAERVDPQLCAKAMRIVDNTSTRDGVVRTVLETADSYLWSQQPATVPANLVDPFASAPGDHWGTRVAISEAQCVCGLGVLAPVGASLLVFPCGHVCHARCVPDNVCISCMTRTFTL
eukprot:TRINITY_DN9851_c0_g1_i2.p1 TRINITY_DN9851_c0_g1~~TRINITY_DN9851_c0_g1_i2.p1  ORF type:complete len:638 (+),score=135.90 TRINITY_DN9851_c0_g1_i2:1275-3188(+)